MKGRRCKMTRESRETRVTAIVNLDGKGDADIEVDAPVLKHMLETLARYSSIDITVQGKGDMDHHLIEDVSLTLGRAFREALGSEATNRLGSATVPMDEALVQIVVDLCDRPYVNVQVDEYGLFGHFLRSFASEGRFTLHARVLENGEEHHLLEATFKAFGLALRQALATDNPVVSTKSRVRWRRG